METDSIRSHIALAKEQEKKLYQVTEMIKPISGFLMVIKKSTWDNIKFSDGCLGIDNNYHLKVIASEKKVLRMNGCYLFHTYRMSNGVRDKSHLV